MKLPMRNMSGWGRYPVQQGFVARPHDLRDIRHLLANRHVNNWIAYGLGRSYGDTALNENGGMMVMTAWNHMLRFDETTGMLECEAGVTFEEILNVMLPRGYFLPVTPGTKFVTVGGAIANDVHGKNHHVNGTFSRYVESITLLVASGEVVTCSRTNHPDLFWATVGGLGLTGIMLTVRFRMIRIETAYFDVHYQRAANLDEALRLFRESDGAYQYSVAWIDCLAKGSALGRCVLMRGNHATAEQVRRIRQPLAVRHGTKAAIPFDFPSFVLNPFTIKVFNQLYYYIHPRDARKIVGYDSFFYPLDSIGQWNRMYGKRGFLQYQAVFPPETCQAGLTEMLEKLSDANRSSFLAVLKSSGEEGEGLLSFPQKGFTLALDIPFDDTLLAFVSELDELVIRHRGRVYLAKDATLTPAHFETMYPRAKQFRQIIRKWDPEQRFSSSMARRLNLVEG
jgi:FAD/FMN-containing dehydrogenase